MTLPANIDWNLIRLLANRSARAYDEQTVCSGRTGAAALVVVEQVNGEPAVIVAFRGSKEPQDFLQDAKFGRTELEWFHDGSIMEVHAGFLQDIESITVDLVQQVRGAIAEIRHGQGIQSNQPKIILTGHSLGGALAVLAALELNYQKLRPAVVVTFGQPRVGNAAFAECYNELLGDRTFHVVNAADPVPLLPPLLSGYRDEGNEIFLPRGRRWQFNPSIGFELISDVLGIFDNWRHRKLALLPNHFIKAYQERLA